MEWVRENWFFIFFALLFIAMHLFGFGCGGHGSHGGHSGHDPDEKDDEHKGDSSGKKEGGQSCH